MTNLLAKLFTSILRHNFQFSPLVKFNLFRFIVSSVLTGILPLQLLILLPKMMKIWQQLFKLVKTLPLVGDMNPTSVDNDNLGDG